MPLRDAVPWAYLLSLIYVIIFEEQELILIGAMGGLLGAEADFTLRCCFAELFMTFLYAFTIRPIRLDMMLLFNAYATRLMRLIK